MIQYALIGTAKGLIVYSINNSEQPHLVGKHFVGFSVNLTFIDVYTGRWWVGISHKHWGQKLHHSDDLGQTWVATALPSYRNINLLNRSPAKLQNLWVMNSSISSDNHTLWVGTEPGGLFKSTDNGITFNLVESLWHHPSRRDNTSWFGTGTKHPFIHSINICKKNPETVYVSVSCAGVFKTENNGRTWKSKNNGLVAAYLPNQNATYGHDPHKVLLHPSDENIMWQQNHCGVFVSKNGGDLWEDVSAASGVPYYGFSLAIDEDNPARAWVIPVESDEQRIAPNLKLQVLRTDNYGGDWVDDSKGLPHEDVFDIVLRQSFVQKSGVMLFGTTNGNIYFKRKEDYKWNELKRNLAKVNIISLSLPL